jgi:hypothetical protein
VLLAGPIFVGLAGEIQGLRRGVLGLAGDVSRAADAQRFVAESLGRVDVLVIGICPGSVAGP